MSEIAEIEWVDSCLANEQTDTLPRPTLIRTVGWLVREEADHVVVCRDLHTDPASYDYRGSCAIPRSAITKLQVWRLA